MGNIHVRENMTKELKDLNLKIEKLLDSEKVYLDKIHNFKEKERYLESKVHDLEWKIKEIENTILFSDKIKKDSNFNIINWNSL